MSYDFAKLRNLKAYLNECPGNFAGRISGVAADPLDDSHLYGSHPSCLNPPRGAPSLAPSGNVEVC